MRRALLLTAVLLAGCASDEMAEDTMAADTGMMTASLTPADVAGTWSGSTMTMEGDSVLRRWTIHTANDTMAHLMLEGVPDTITYYTTFSGDSMIAVSEPYTMPDMPDMPVTFRSVGRMENGMLRGTVAIRLASNADSVIERDRWEASRAP
jgi:hypothetical protein